MNNSTALRTLATFAVLVPLAIFMGYMLANPLQYSTFATIGFVLAVMLFPILLRWHQPMLLFAWNMSVIIPFIKGQPPLWTILAALALGIAILERTLNREMRFIQIWQITLPLLCFVAVVLMTAKLTGGLGFRAFGGDVFGGRKYAYLLAAIAAYFALTAWKIPTERAGVYVGLFLLGGLTNAVGDFFTIAPSSFQFIFWFFPPSSYFNNEIQLGITRLGGISAAAQAVIFFIVFRYGFRGIFLSGRPLRLFLFMLFMGISFLGGYRSMMLLILLVLTFHFFLEGMHKSRLLPLFVFAAMLTAVLLIPLASKLPYTFQRALAVFPLEVDPKAKMDAEGSSDWRIEMWKALLPKVPKYLFLGKGYAITQDDYEMMGFDTAFRTIDASQQGLALSGDYHNGPLSVIIPFGIWGAIIFIWLMWAGVRVLYLNYRHGDPEVKGVNTFLLALFLAKLVMFLFIFGGLSSDIAGFLGILGLNVSVNNGVRRSSTRAVETEKTSLKPRLLQPRPSFQR